MTLVLSFVLFWLGYFMVGGAMGYWFRNLEEAIEDRG